MIRHSPGAMEEVFEQDATEDAGWSESGSDSTQNAGFAALNT